MVKCFILFCQRPETPFCPHHHTKRWHRLEVRPGGILRSLQHLLHPYTPRKFSHTSNLTAGHWLLYVKKFSKRGFWDHLNLPCFIIYQVHQYFNLSSFINQFFHISKKWKCLSPSFNSSHIDWEPAVCSRRCSDTDVSDLTHSPSQKEDQNTINPSKCARTKITANTYWTAFFPCNSMKEPLLWTRVSY